MKRACLSLLISCATAYITSTEQDAIVEYFEEFDRFGELQIAGLVSYCHDQIEGAACTGNEICTEETACCTEEEGVFVAKCRECVPNCDINTTPATFGGMAVVCGEDDQTEAIEETGKECATSGNHGFFLGLEDSGVSTIFTRAELLAEMKATNWSSSSSTQRTGVTKFLLEESVFFLRPLVQGKSTYAVNGSIAFTGGAANLYQPTNHGGIDISGNDMDLYIRTPTNTGPIYAYGSASIAVKGGSNTGQITVTSSGRVAILGLTNSGSVSVTNSEVWVKNVINSGSITATGVAATLENIKNTGTFTAVSGQFKATGIDNSEGTIVVTAATDCDIVFITGKGGTFTDSTGACTTSEAAAPDDSGDGDDVFSAASAVGPSLLIAAQIMYSL